MSSFLIYAIAVVAPILLVMGILVLLGKFDTVLLKNAAKKGEAIDLARSRKVLGWSLIGDSVVFPAIMVAIFYFCE